MCVQLNNFVPQLVFFLFFLRLATVGVRLCRFCRIGRVGFEKTSAKSKSECRTTWCYLQTKPSPGVNKLRGHPGAYWASTTEAGLASHVPLSLGLSPGALLEEVFPHGAASTAVHANSPANPLHFLPPPSFHGHKRSNFCFLLDELFHQQAMPCHLVVILTSNMCPTFAVATLGCPWNALLNV